MSTAQIYPGIDALPPSGRGDPAWGVALCFPLQGEWTEQEFLALDRNGEPRMMELVDGCLEILPMPSLLHQFIARFLFEHLNSYVSARKLGHVLFAPLPVHLRDKTLREPDIVFLKPERIKDIEGQPEGADLVMEVVSPGKEDRKRDLVDKPIDYARAGIPEYWIIDPEKEQISVLRLEGSQYGEPKIYGPGTTAKSELLVGFELSTNDVFAAGRTLE